MNPIWNEETQQWLKPVESTPALRLELDEATESLKYAGRRMAEQAAEIATLRAQLAEREEQAAEDSAVLMKREQQLRLANERVERLREALQSLSSFARAALALAKRGEGEYHA